MGLLYCSGEPNSVYQIETVRGYLEDMGYTCEVYAFTDVNDLSSASPRPPATPPTSSTSPPTTPSRPTPRPWPTSCIPAGVPVVGGDPGICSGCGVATVTIDYYELGRLTGELAAQILKGETDISTLPIQYLEPLKVYNAANCETLGVTVPEGYSPVE